MRYAARSDVGLVREGNEDSAYAGPRLLAVADGLGGHAHGEVASAVAISALAPLDGDISGADLTGALEAAIRDANATLHQMVGEDPSLEGMGTTLTAMLWSGGCVGVAHIGDSRAYLLRDGDLYQITRDQTLVQKLVDEGRITMDEAATHPRRSLLLRALDGRGEVELETNLREAKLGDRYLLCSDGLSTVVSADTLLRTLSTVPDPEQATRELIDLANRGGGPDNITCIVADVVESGTGPMPDRPVVAGAAANATRRAEAPPEDTPASRACDTPTGMTPTIDEEDGDEEDDFADEEARPRRRRWPWAFGVIILVLVVAGAGYAGYQYTQGRYYVGAQGTEVVIYRGVNQNVAGLGLSKVFERTGINVSDLPAYAQDAVRGTMEPGTLNAARDAMARLRREADACKKAAQPTPRPTRSGHLTVKPSPRPSVPNGCPGAPA
ncbi:MAG: PP2C family protein-serine/threonine phosphatase [Actinoallomurus sp.]